MIVGTSQPKDDLGSLSKYNKLQRFKSLYTTRPLFFWKVLLRTKLKLARGTCKVVWYSRLPTVDDLINGTIKKNTTKLLRVDEKLSESEHLLTVPIFNY